MSKKPPAKPSDSVPAWVQATGWLLILGFAYRSISVLENLALKGKLTDSWPIAVITLVALLLTYFVINRFSATDAAKFLGSASGTLRRLQRNKSDNPSLEMDDEER